MWLRAFWFTWVAIPLAVPALAREMRLTIYDDGISCPANCDAHFVMNRADNGTSFAFRPDSGRTAPQRCPVNEDCTICFDESDGSCCDDPGGIHVR